MDSTFSLFPSFPLEIRWAIWECCLPHRVIELDSADQDDSRQPLPRTCRQLSTTSITNRCPPVISRVCREARQVALRHGSEGGWETVRRSKNDDADADADEPIYSLYSSPWIQPGRDILHLHWTPFTHASDVWYDFDDPDKPIQLLHHLQARVQPPAISILADLVLPFRRRWVDRRSWDYRFTDAVKEISRGDEYMVVLKMVPLHIRPDVATLSGLFGVAGDERIKLVDPDDWATMNQYQTLWRLHGSVLDADAAEFFDSVVPQHDMGPETSELSTRVAQWRHDFVKVWIWHRWKRHRVRDDNALPELEADRVWLGEDRWGDAPAPTYHHWEAPPRPWGIDIEEREPNYENPWVQDIREKMPQFHPRIMFRLCARECHRPEHERPRLRWRPVQRSRGGGPVNRRFPGTRTPPWPPGWPPRAPETGSF